MTLLWHGHASNKMAAMFQETSELLSCTQCKDVSLCLGTIIGTNSVFFASSASLLHHLVVESCVHYVQSCAFPHKHERMWQTTEVNHKINNLERTCPTCVCTKHCLCKHRNTHTHEKHTGHKRHAQYYVLVMLEGNSWTTRLMTMQPAIAEDDSRVCYIFLNSWQPQA